MAAALVQQPDFRPETSQMSSFKEDTTNSINKVPYMSRLSTPKPIMHLGSSTEFHGQPSAKTTYKPGTGYRSGTGFKPNTFGNSGTSFKPGTSAFRPETGIDTVSRPMTAVQGAGYTSHGKPFYPLNQAASVPTPPLELQKDDSSEERIKQQEYKILQLVEDACIAHSDGDFRKALTKTS